MARSLVVVCLAFAGILLLAGPGWALLAGAVLVLAFWPRGTGDRVTDLGRQAAERGRRLAGRVRSAPRRAVAGAGMAAGVALAPAGFAVALGLGAGLIAAGAALTGLALLTGWNA